MGKKKRGTTARNNNNRTNNHLDAPMTRRPEDIIPIHLADIPEDHIRQYNLREIADEDGYVYCGMRSDPRSSDPIHARATWNAKEKKVVALPTTTTTASLSIGDTVKINGLVNASEYNGTRGVIVSEFDVTTNRCGVRVTGKNPTLMAIQIANLTLERRAKKSTIGNANVDRGGGSPVVRQLLVHHEWHEAEDGTMQASNNQRGHSSSPLVLATEREVVSTRIVPTTDSVHADSHIAKHITKIMKDISKCKKDAAKVLLTTLRAGDCDSFRQGLIVNGLISVILGLLKQCEHKEFNEMVDKVKGNLQTPADWIDILACFCRFEQCKLEIANGIQAVVRCLCDDTKRLFFKSNKYWHDAVTPFVRLVTGLLFSSDDSASKVTAATVVIILLQNKGFLESMVHRCFWTSYRPDLVKEYESHQLSVDVKTLEAYAHIGIKNIIFIGLKRNVTETDAELNCLTIHEVFSQDGLDLITNIAKTPVVNKAYDPECKVNYVVGKIRMLKLVNSVDRWDQFSILNCMFTFNADYVDNDVIADVIKLGRRFTANIYDAINILRLSYSMLVQKAQGNIYPIDKKIAFAIKSGLLEMCVEFITRFECGPSVDFSFRDTMIGCLVCIADLIQKVALHQNTSKAIRDRQSLIMEALKPLIRMVKSKQTTQFVDLLSSIMELNEGSCSRCNKPIEWHTALFCEGCRRVTYCGVKCQKMDWRHGTHSSDCSFLARSADMMGLTMFDVKSSRNISELTGLRNNIVTSQKKLFLVHKVSLFSQLVCCSDKCDCVAVFDLSNKQRSIIVEHYHVVFACPKQRKWFEDVRSPGKVICVFVSQIFNGEFDEDGVVNIIHLFAIFPIPKHIQSV
jgi:hypothetical protein